MRRRIVIAAVATALAIVLAAGLLSRGGGGSALADAAERIDGQSAHMRLQMRGTDEDGSYSVSGEGPYAADGSRASIRATFEQGGDKVRMELRNIRDEFWIRYIGVDVMPPGKTWMHSVDPNVAPTTLTPAEFARFLAEADEVAEVSDDERIRGETTTHYRGLVDVGEMADEVGGETRRRFDRLFRDRSLRLPVEAWVSEDGLPVRIRATVDARDEQVDMTVDLLEFGVPVDVEVPPAGTVIEEDEFDAYIARLREGGRSR